MHLFSTVVFCAALVSAAPRVLSNTNSINQLTRRTALLDKDLARLSEDEAKGLLVNGGCWADGRIKWPQNDLPLPSKNEVSRQLSVFKSPTSTPNTLTVHNYCDYDIHYEHMNQQTKLDSGAVKAGAAYTAPLSGSVWKGSKSADMIKVVLIEYSVSLAMNLMWYNLSLIECLGVQNAMKTTDTSGCAGHEAGLQFGNQQSMSFQCAPGMWCDDQAYLYEENLCKTLNPISTCKPDVGVTMEFCARNKK